MSIQETWARYRMVAAAQLWLLIVLCCFGYFALTTAYFIMFWGKLPWWCVTLECVYILPMYVSMFGHWGFIQSCAWESNCMDWCLTAGMYAG